MESPILFTRDCKGILIPDYGVESYTERVDFPPLVMVSGVEIDSHRVVFVIGFGKSNL